MAPVLTRFRRNAEITKVDMPRSRGNFEMTNCWTRDVSAETSK
jgi:hypothetical protein